MPPTTAQKAGSATHRQRAVAVDGVIKRTRSTWRSGWPFKSRSAPAAFWTTGASTDSGRRRLACPMIFLPKRFSSSVGRDKLGPLQQQVHRRGLPLPTLLGGDATAVQVVANGLQGVALGAGGRCQAKR